MSSSIIEQSKTAKRWGSKGGWKRKIIVLAVIAGLGGGGYYFYSWKQKNAQSASQAATIKQAAASKGDLRIAVSNTGKVVAEDGVSLSFSVSGDSLEVENVFVKEGDQIKKGDKIATVKTKDLEFELKTAQNSYQSALININSKLEGPTDEEIAKAKNSIEQAEISLQSAKDSLAQTKVNNAEKILQAENAIVTAQNNLDNYAKDLAVNIDKKETAIDTAYQSLANTIISDGVTIGTTLDNIDKILGIDNPTLNDEFEYLLAAGDSASLNSAQNYYRYSKEEKKALDNLLAGFSIYSSQTDIKRASDQTKIALEKLRDCLSYVGNALDATVTDADFTQSELDSKKSSISSSRSSINSAISSLATGNQSIDSAVKDYNALTNNEETYQMALDKAKRDLESAKNTAEADVKNGETTIKTRESSLAQAKISYDELVAGPTESEMASARVQLSNAAISLEKAKYKLEQATMTSPIDGKVVQLNYKAGDIILSSDAKAMATIINYDTLFIELNVEESDVNKIKVGQKAYAAFDALDSTTLEGEITFISLTAETDNSGIVTYLVRVVLNDSSDGKIREGMTAAVDFITAEAKDVVYIPVAAVKNIDGNPSVYKSDGSAAAVTTGFTDGKNVEIISGLSEGDKIIY